MTEPPKNPGTAAVLSAIIPGLGQFYNGEFWRGIFWLIVTPGLWIGSRAGVRLPMRYATLRGEPVEPTRIGAWAAPASSSRHASPIELP